MSTSAAERYERLQKLVLDLGLPVARVHVLPARCPYCGKSDRIHALVDPAEERGVPAERREEYETLWEVFGGKGMGVCKFCHQLVRLGPRGTASALFDPGAEGG